MLKSITLQDTATYQLATIDNLAQINFFYGANGSGKTTISKVIANPAQFTNCPLIWENGNSLQSMVYNHDFVSRNFNFDQCAELKGIFTLGEDQVDAEKKINVAKQEYEKIQKNIDSDKRSKEQKEIEKQNLETNFKETVWELKNKYASCFQEIFTGLMSSKEKFKNKVLKEYEQNKNNMQANTLQIDDLKKQYITLFQSDLKSEIELSSISVEFLIDCETNPILQKKIIGSADVNISTLIAELGNSDWVRKGISFLK